MLVALPPLLLLPSFSLYSISVGPHSPAEALGHACLTHFAGQETEASPTWNSDSARRAPAKPRSPPFPRGKRRANKTNVTRPGFHAPFSSISLAFTLHILFRPLPPPPFFTAPPSREQVVGSALYAQARAVVGGGGAGRELGGRGVRGLAFGPRRERESPPLECAGAWWLPVSPWSGKVSGEAAFATRGNGRRGEARVSAGSFA